MTGDERSRCEPAGRDAVAPKARAEPRVHPSEASGADADPRRRDEDSDERSREEPAGRDAVAPAGASGSAIAPEAKRAGRAWKRLRRSKISAGALIGVLTAILGFGIAVQVRSNSSSDSLANAREDDLIRILDDQNARADRLDQQIADLQRTLTELRRSGNNDAVAQQQAEDELASLRVLLGTVRAAGPGVIATISDPQRKLAAEDLLDVVEELRGAGAEAIQFGPVRVGTSTNFTDTGAGVSVDGQQVKPPYTVLAIGEPKTLDTALNIPGGVAATARPQRGR